MRTEDDLRVAFRDMERLTPDAADVLRAVYDHPRRPARSWRLPPHTPRRHALRAAGKLRLIDWDTAGLALPERDLWSVAEAGSREAERYAELTGRCASTAALHMYRVRWSLDEIALSVSDFRGPHEHNEDTELTWAVLTDETESVLRLVP